MNIFNLSFGKDSMATLILAAEQGIAIDHVMYVDIKYNDKISGEHPIMAAWIPEAERKLREQFGVTVTHVFDKGVTFESQFFRQYQRGAKVGYIYGFPGIKGAWCNTILKTQPINHYIKQFDETVQFIGIAADEPSRWTRMKLKETGKRKYRSLLVEQGLTENDAMEICKRYDLLSPLYNYEDTYRGGCWFCPKQCMADLYHLWRDYPERFEMLLDLEDVSTYTLRPGVTLKELAEKFENGYIPKRKSKNIRESVDKPKTV